MKKKIVNSIGGVKVHGSLLDNFSNALKDNIFVETIGNRKNKKFRSANRRMEHLF